MKFNRRGLLRRMKAAGTDHGVDLDRAVIARNTRTRAERNVWITTYGRTRKLCADAAAYSRFLHRLWHIEGEKREVFRRMWAEGMGKAPPPGGGA